MIPLDDPDIERSRYPVLTVGLIAANVLIFLYQLSLDPIEVFAFVYKFGAIPVEILGNSQLVAVPVQTGVFVTTIDVKSPIPDWATMFSSMFIHGGFLHLGGNMIYLWVFGKTVEDRFGHLAFAVLYVVAGIVGTLSQSWVDQSSEIPMVGASGAIAGVLGAYLLLYPLSRVRILLWMFLITVVRVPAIILLGFWAVIQFFNSVGSTGPEVGSSGGVAYFAHLGGFVFGAVIVGAYQLTRLGRFTVQGATNAIMATRMSLRKRLRRARNRTRNGGSRHWSSVFCPSCGSDELEYLDPPVRRWRCMRCFNLFA